MGKINLTPLERARLRSGDFTITEWGEGGMPSGQEKQRWYDKYGREFILPAMPDMDKFRRGRGLSLVPPPNPEPLVVVDPAEQYMDEAHKMVGHQEESPPMERPAEPERPPPLAHPKMLSWDVE